MTLTGHVKNGTIVFDQPIVLPEGAAVQVEVLKTNEARQVPATEEIPTLYERLKPFIGAIDDLPPDFSINHDHYLYGAPKRT
jgi:hypothetical protein